MCFVLYFVYNGNLDTIYTSVHVPYVCMLYTFELLPKIPPQTSQYRRSVIIVAYINVNKWNYRMECRRAWVQSCVRLYECVNQYTIRMLPTNTHYTHSHIYFYLYMKIIIPFREIIKAKFNFIITGIWKRDEKKYCCCVFFFSLSFKHNFFLCCVRDSLNAKCFAKKVLNVFWVEFFRSFIHSFRSYFFPYSSSSSSRLRMRL